ncbi:hypothetical protein CDL15_Pgr000426 [Punica granatum]|uniref:Uncharacterized protein n=1 Tax=Punica granatum TaxID=22663 RepID=A0A218W290_PUNGR|nr:hypothetical protein CDL15_Pgr000426 [Punica granatum]
MVFFLKEEELNRPEQQNGFVQVVPRNWIEHYGCPLFLQALVQLKMNSFPFSILEGQAFGGDEPGV